MRSQYIVGYTDTEGGEDALALALALADAADHEVAVTVASISILDPYGLSSRGVHRDYERALADDAEDRLQDARKRLAERTDVSFVVRAGTSPAHGLQLLADELDADAIVVGRSHTGPVGRAFVGSVTEQTLHGAACAVVVAPKGYAVEVHQAISTVAVAYDGSDESEHALTRATALARSLGAGLRLVRAIEPMPIAYGQLVDPYPFAERRTNVADALRAAADGIAGLDVTTTVLDGEASTALSGPGVGADLLVTGSRDFGPVGRILLGGTSARLARHCPTPLVVVPRFRGEAVSAPVAADAQEVTS